MVKLTPPMGWNTWNTFANNIDEKLILEAADAMVNEGLLEAGYEYLVMDDCWALHERDENGRLVPDPEKFPHGMKYLADYIHSKGLKFGMYSCAGTMTCGGYPSSFEHEFIDAQTFAEWEIDFLKYDYCYKPKTVDGPTLYRRMGMALANTGRDILFNSCSWGVDSTEEWVRSTGASQWRSTQDIFDTWKSIKDIHSQQIRLQPYNSLGCYNDMDMLVVGMNGKGHVGLAGCTYNEYKTHFSLWAMLNSPLVIGCDIRNMDEETKSILLNKDIIAINQDKGGRQPFLAGGTPWIIQEQDHYIWVKQLEGGDLAIGYFNLCDTPIRMSLNMHDIGLGHITGKTLALTELWTKETEVVKNDVLMKEVSAHDCLVYRAKLING